MIVSGASSSEAAGALRQLAQGLSTGVLRGDELNSVMEQMPPVADAIAQKLGVTTGELKKLAEQGKITREVVFEAMADSAKRFDEQFAQTSPSISQSFSKMTNSLLELGKASGVFDVLTKSMEGWTKVFDSATKSFGGAGTASTGVASAATHSTAALVDRFSSGAGMQGNIRPPEVTPTTSFGSPTASRDVGGGGDPWNTTIIPVSWEEQLREMKEAWDELNQAQLATLDDLIGDKTEIAATKIEALTEAVHAGEIGWRDYQDRVAAVQQFTEQANDAMLSSTSQFLTTMFQNSKTAATASALINTYQGITKALASYPPPQSYAMAAMQAAMGFAQVRSIQSTSKTSTGGSANLGGAAAGSAIEGGAAGASAPAAAQNQTMTVQLGSLSGLIDGRGLRDLMERLVDAQRNGYQLVVA